jgi:hypothetical protein
MYVAPWVAAMLLIACSTTHGEHLLTKIPSRTIAISRHDTFHHLVYSKHKGEEYPYDKENGGNADADNEPV